MRYCACEKSDDSSRCAREANVFAFPLPLPLRLPLPLPLPLLQPGGSSVDCCSSTAMLSASGGGAVRCALVRPRKVESVSYEDDIKMFIGHPTASQGAPTH